MVLIRDPPLKRDSESFQSIEYSHRSNSKHQINFLADGEIELTLFNSMADSDFPERESQQQLEGTDLLFSNLSAANGMKMKVIGPTGAYL